jgi:hypothetical protein
MTSASSAASIRYLLCKDSMCSSLEGGECCDRRRDRKSTEDMRMRARQGSWPPAMWRAFMWSSSNIGPPTLKLYVLPGRASELGIDEHIQRVPNDAEHSYIPAGASFGPSTVAKRSARDAVGR